ncbi:hypothetical protein HMPREF3038_02783 [Akkermansia sp. KLE1797]|nr:hypothetical protein HMPREF3038_02783 [Akkermansia sp. KLE1797]KXU53116.1 hypothetical protein HMPREF3039_02672 [Akkermansia sp. KLE1798]KZA03755.1 hypothetical protein HMPREF1326_02528 [Akkermansia sp. KLE1605]
MIYHGLEIRSRCFSYSCLLLIKYLLQLRIEKRSRISYPAPLKTMAG